MKVRELTLEVKETARANGAALVGIAPAERFDPMPPVYDSAPEGQHPSDFVHGARSVISFAMPILPAVMDAPALLAEKKFEAMVKFVFNICFYANGRFFFRGLMEKSEHLS